MMRSRISASIINAGRGKDGLRFFRRSRKRDKRDDVPRRDIPNEPEGMIHSILLQNLCPKT